jgi:hypothetical protein
MMRNAIERVRSASPPALVHASARTVRRFRFGAGGDATIATGNGGLTARRVTRSDNAVPPGTPDRPISVVVARQYGANVTARG